MKAKKVLYRVHNHSNGLPKGFMYVSSSSEEGSVKKYLSIYNFVPKDDVHVAEIS